MLRSMKALRGYRVRATDSMAGTVRDFLFDDDTWTVRYMVVDAGSRWFTGRQALVAARFLGRPEWEAGVVPVRQTKAQLTGKPPPRTARPSARERELEPHGARARRSDGEAVGPQGKGRSAAGAQGDDPDPQRRPEENLAELSLRSGREVTGYRIDAVDGYAGRVQDFIVDDESWVIRYMVVDTGRWFPGRKVLVVPLWVESMTWAGRTARVGLHRTVIAASRAYLPSAPVNREYEVRLYDYYGRPKRWR
ncbi:MAG: hypothetical protein ACYTKD_22295 [Planctomycetota bacterium]|jgi:hypothetical protein